MASMGIISGDAMASSRSIYATTPVCMLGNLDVGPASPTQVD
ncbi:MAG: hypothetical protein E5299_00756 [Burkholderia gladioli]|nr:MAG: hypothetical protein E5299_00756 [Burkholderia gladioli]